MMAEREMDEAAHKAGADAFCKAMRKTTTEVLEDAQLFDAFGALWDCRTLAELRDYVETAARTAATDVTGILLHHASAAWLDAVRAQIGAPVAPGQATRSRSSALAAR